jgi:glutamyl-tRNA reductase
MPIFAIGLSYHDTPVAIRDAVAVAPQDVHAALRTLSGIQGVSEAGLISTCNRTEVYLLAEEEASARAGTVAALSGWGGLTAETVDAHLFVHQDEDAVRHLFGVASGLDSMIMGEPQIAGQVKDAGAASMAAGTSRTVLNRLFRAAVETSKRARTETEIGAGAVSVSFAAVELAKKIFGDLSTCKALILGAGEMSELTALHLVDAGVESLLVASRTHTRAQDLAERVRGQALPWEEGLADLHRADMVISATSAPDYVLQRDVVAQAMQRRRNDQMFLIDIAVPRDIDPGVGELYNVLLYDIDDLQTVVGANLQRRQQEAEKVRAIVEAEVASFRSWLNSLNVVPAIVALRQHFHGVAEAELARAKLPEFTNEQRSRVAALLRLCVNKLLHSPQTRLKESADSGDGLAYVDSLMRLFDLEMADDQKSREKPRAREVQGKDG